MIWFFLITMSILWAFIYWRMFTPVIEQIFAKRIAKRKYEEAVQFVINHNNSASDYKLPFPPKPKILD